MMDKKKAADLLDNLIGMVEDSHGADYDTALRMGIEALSADGDTIYRQAAIDAALDSLPDDEYWNEQVCKAINKLPPAQPERNYCRDCKWSRCHINVDKHGKTEMYWRCLNWDGETDEEGYCHE